MKPEIIVRQLGEADYNTTWTAMRAFTDTRASHTPDELWLIEHPPVYTMGLKGRHGTVADINNIPLVYSDRGGDITYHGPGQIVLYAMIDIGRLGIGIKTLVQSLEQIVIDYLSDNGIGAARRAGAPGVYVRDRKIAALGLRVRRNCSYHGLAFNIDMDLEPFNRIDPCGYQGLQVTQLAAFGRAATPADAGIALAHRLSALLGYNAPVILPPTHLVASTPHG
jgi:lipoyl(octanoyl) transferase